MSFTATITSKGQITIPREIRNFLDSRTVEIEVVNREVRIRPIRNVAGALAKYAEGKQVEPLSEIRDKVWEEVASDRKS
ncbi:MAG: hypothetical protein A2512_04960 [Deltaproteobacteria bacterium RIFOXYD12_FULL_56_24]|nr:MAG: hypothetical protein A2512_04960 [Deltaproteobacteria bacterium RIFOXYD12_FULL_56_24]